MSSTSWYLIARLASQKSVLAEENENNNPKWTLATMEKYMLDESDDSLSLGLMPRHPKPSGNGRYPVPLRQEDRVNEHCNGEAAESPGDESSPSWASSSTGNTPSYSSGGTAFEFDRQKTETLEKLRNSATAPLITTTSCTPTSTPVNSANKKISASRGAAVVASRDVKCCLNPALSADLLQALDSDQEGSREPLFTRKSRKGSAGSMKDGVSSQSGTPSKSGSRLSRLLRRTHSAGCSKEGVDQSPVRRGKPPVTKTKSADAAPCSREDEEAKQKRNRKTLAQDMKMRLSFLRRRHTDSSLQPSVRPSPEEAHKWAESFSELMNSKYGLSLFRAFLSREFSEENIEFWLACEDYKRSRGNKLTSKARKIYDDFVAVQSPKEVNLDSNMRSAILDHLQNPDRHSFDSAQRRIQGLMEQDAYIRFLQSELYTELLKCPEPES